MGQIFNPAGSFTGGVVTSPLLEVDGTSVLPTFSFNSQSSTGAYKSNTAEISFALAGTQRYIFAAGAFTVVGGTAAITLASTIMVGEDANVLALRSGLSAQSFRLYNTYTDSSNYERAVFDWTSISNILTIGSKSVGTGIQRVINFDASQYAFLVNSVNSLRLTGSALVSSTNGVISLGSNTLGYKQFYVDYTNTATLGAVTINKAAGRVNMAAGLGFVVVTNSFCTANAHVFLSAGPSGNAVGVSFEITPGAGTFTINAVPAVINNTAIDFFIVNAD